MGFVISRALERVFSNIYYLCVSVLFLRQGMVSFTPSFLVCKAITPRSKTQAQLMNPLLGQCLPRDGEGGSRRLVQSPWCPRARVPLPAPPQPCQPHGTGSSPGRGAEEHHCPQMQPRPGQPGQLGGVWLPPNGDQGCDPLHTHHSGARLGAHFLELLFSRLWGYF